MLEKISKISSYNQKKFYKNRALEQQTHTKYL